MIERTFKGKLLVFSVFFLGIVSGALMTYAWETRVSSAVRSVDVKSAARARADVDRFYDYVGLSPEQRIQVKQITEDSRPEVNRVIQQTRPQMEAIQKQTRSKIRAVLTEEQKKKYDEFNAENEARRNKQKSQLPHSN
jgi:uncharacterized membrane protein